MIYDYKCNFCGHQTERICKVAERNDYTYCGECHSLMERVPSFGGGLKTEHPTWLDGTEPGLGKTFSTRAEHDAYCRDNGFVQR